MRCTLSQLLRFLPVLKLVNIHLALDWRVEVAAAYGLYRVPADHLEQIEKNSSIIHISEKIFDGNRSCPEVRVAPTSAEGGRAGA